ncbi:MAG TPA: gliding motility-associated C-terminal domain-containing protein, partial [Bacteroidales bacterium]|nr:gliding motility-associated C-terminal domain-containing protein [Bacteroidales bacterium]
NQLPTVTVTALPNPQCANEPVNLNASASGGTSPYTYAWDNGLGSGNSHTVNPVANTTYNVTVTDSNGCSNTGNVSVSINSLPTINVVETAQATCGSANGIATATAGGAVGPYTYEWSNGDNSSDGIAENLPAGFYTVTTTDQSGCSISGSVIVSSPVDITSNAVQIVPVSCYGGSNGTGQLTVSGGNPPYNITWTNGSSSGFINNVNVGTFILTNLTAGTYSIQVTDQDNCVSTTTLTITQPTAIGITYALNQAITCYGNSDGEATISVTGGVPNYDISWSNGSVSDNLTNVNGGPHIISNLNAGTYTITVTDDSGCTQTTSMVITQPQMLGLNFVVTNEPSCNSSDDGSIEITVTGGTPLFDINWSNGISSGSLNDVAAGPHTINDVTAGIYSISITDINSCTFSTNNTINEPIALTISGSMQSAVSCFSEDDGVAEVTVSGGTPTYIIEYSNGITSGSLSGLNSGNHTITDLTAGDYQLTVTDSNGCTANTSFSITEPTAVTATINQSNVLCYGNNNGSAEVIPGGGVPGYTYEWQNESLTVIGTNSTISNLVAGTYFITVTDSHSCTGASSVTITEPGSINLSLSHTDASTYGNIDGQASVAVTGGTPPYNYSWENSANPGVIVGTTATITGLAAGDYCVTVTDNQSCSSTGCVTVSQPPDQLIGVLQSQNNVSCYGLSDGNVNITAFGGTPDYAYHWENLSGVTISTGPSATDLPAGNYYLTITDSMGYTWSTEITISQPAEMIITSASGDNLNCYGDSDGVVAVSVSGGNIPYSYHWEDESGNDLGINNSTVSNLQEGSYFVTIIDANNCPAIDTSMLIIQPDEFTAQISLFNNPLCFGSADGSLQVSVSGGTSPVSTYNWDDPISSYHGDNPQNLSAGTYTVTAIDSHGCTAEVSQVLTEPSALNTSLTATPTTGFGSDDGSANAAVSGGTPPYSYSWENSANPGVIVSTSNPAINLTAGTYCVTVSDSHGCTATDCVSVTEPEQLNVSINSTDADCHNNSTGSATAVVSGGILPYTYQWQNSSGSNIGSGSSISNLPADTYYITVTDANLFTATAMIIITEPEELLISGATVTNVSCNGLTDGSVVILVTGGTTPYQFIWHELGNPTVLSTSSELNEIAAGSYVVEITDQHGCTFTQTYTITQPDDLIIDDVDVSNIICPYDDGSGTAEIFAEGGTPPYSYTWILDGNTLAFTGSVLTSANAGDYSVSVHDSNNCNSSLFNFTITIPDDLALIADIDSVVCFGENNGSIVLTANGGSGGYIYSWDPPVSTTNSAFNLLAGTYAVTITDGSMCTFSANYTVGQPADALSGTFSQTDQISCNGFDNGAGTITLSGGTPPYQINWINGGNTYSESGVITNTFNIHNLRAGNLNITIADSRNCSYNFSSLLSEPTALQSEFINVLNLSCFNDNSGAFSVNVTGGTGDYSYIYDNNGIPTTNTSYNQLAAGWHYITVSDENNCILEDSILLTEPALLTTNLIDTISLNCFGDENGSAAISIGGGTPNYNVTWNNSMGSQIGTGLVVMNLTAGKFYVQVIDSHNCTTIDSIQVIQPDNLIANLSRTNPKCFGSSDGKIWATVTGGTSPYNFEWSVSSIDSDTLFNLPAGHYTVTISDNHNCHAEAEIELVNPPQLSSEMATTDVDCSDHMGSAQVTVNGGTPPYQYLWSNSATGYYINNIAGGEYQVTITDFNGCTLIDDATVEISGSIGVTISQLFQIRCYGDATAVLSAVSNGHQPIEYIWSEGNYTTQIVENLPVGTYTVTVTDSWGCTGTDEIQVNQPQQMVVDFVTTDVLCKFGSTGTARAIVSQGTPGYTYFWMHSGNTSNNVSGLSAGTYTLQITDNNSCTILASVMIHEPDSALSAVVISQNSTCNNSNDGQAGALGTGGTAPYSYIWEAPNGSTIGTSFTGNNLIPGMYYLTVTDNNNCVYSTSTLITEPSPIYIDIAASGGPSCYGNTDGYILLEEITGGTPPYHVFISSGSINWEQEVILIDSIPAGVYRIDVVDNNNCHNVGDALLVVLNDSEIDCLQIPAAFSPNSDGSNDTWEITHVEMFPRILIQVYNRWGQLLYEAGYNDEYWDGTYNGAPVPTGPYLYYIDLNNNTDPITGTVTIIR